MKTRWYIGCSAGKLTAFQSPFTPTELTHGHLYGAVIGPFKTKRGVLWAQKYGRNNPNFHTVNDAERLAIQV